MEIISAEETFFFHPEIKMETEGLKGFGKGMTPKFTADAEDRFSIWIFALTAKQFEQTCQRIRQYPSPPLLKTLNKSVRFSAG